MGISSTPFVNPARTFIAQGQEKSPARVAAQDPLVLSLALAAARQAVAQGATLATIQNELEKYTLDVVA